ncbi:hypothetical protein PYL72_09550 [Paenibacillus larvae subsp. larvae]|uniref:hypothetical protein n=1 Tax=Paenibacillus larvae TaxID=1464 RepID=UPI0023A95E65|nr:hypothetical protein [Paenibacillus larvae]MDE5127001.1 hypothetical protein [Paenibacillus larvae subsp. larvae]MDE5134209.1 hypothetical protein [Paenibacillus larvae subsp. larvae]MDE5138281.1 hypothetical protein [Paenibacillus larvae subsp. larvae]MDE5142852.1 hypothetical protein [Paenibacillus larvae subsp. larvae]MDE5150616.1 hypothetical protein [Paenibacillus larvae subsp. larvae]
MLAEKGGTVRQWMGTENVMNIPGVVHFGFDKQVGDTVVMPLKNLWTSVFVT